MVKKWSEQSKSHDMIWTELPKNWTEGAFVGNGTMGGMLYYCEEEKVFHLELGRNDICDTRKGELGSTDVCYQNPRLPIGAMEWRPKGDIKTFRMRLDLNHGQIVGKVETTLGKTEFQIFVHAREMVLVIAMKNVEGEENDRWTFVSEDAISPRQQYGLEKKQDFRIKKDYVYYEKPLVEQTEYGGFSRQKLDQNMENVVCFKKIEEKDESYTLIHVEQGKEGSLEKAQKYLESLNHPADLWPSHAAWWKTYYEKSCIHIPDKKLEDFYWIQMYKLACASGDREDGVVMDNQGPWLCGSTPWPATWWNLNVQLAYLPCYVSNHLEITKPLSGSLRRNFDNLIKNVPKEFQFDSAGIGTVSDLALRSPVHAAGGGKVKGFRELGNLTWVMYNCWLYYQMSMDKEYLKTLVYPILRRCMNYYFHFLYKGEDGYYHLPDTFSPEYGQECPDCNYDLALLRFGCRTLLKIVKILRVGDEKEKMWNEVLEHLTPYPTDETGFMIGAGLPYSQSHRHFSHLMMIYPLHEFTADDTDMVPLLKKSIQHWWSKPEYMAGFSYTGASLLWSTLGDGDQALSYLKGLWEGSLLPNTLYKEEGPVIETPLSGVQCILEMMIQSHNGVIRLFPAMPIKWEEASFERLLAEGAFEVSAGYEKGELVYVEIYSKAGSPCVVEWKNWESMDVSDERIKRIGDSRISIKLKENERIRMERKER